MSVSLRPFVHPGRAGLIGLAGLAGLAGLVLTPAIARGGDGEEPRAPVVWDDPGDPNDGPACMTIVDRSVDPVFHLEYSLLYEDTKKTADEVEDSRRHQFFGFCRHHSRQEFLPNWISEADVAAADAKGIVVSPPGPEDILDTAEAWQGCFVRIIGDDERRLITNAEAAKGVDWDTSDLPVGPYFVEGYNWHPAGNQWYTRGGVVKVVDSLDPAASPPAIALVLAASEFWDYETLRVDGCVSAVDGSTITASWSFPDPIAWVPFAVDVPVEGDAFAVDFAAPPGTEGFSVLLKVELTDPMDRTVTAHANELVFVIKSMGATTTGGECGSTFIADPSCSETTTTDDTASTGDGGTTIAGTSGATTDDPTATTTAAHGDDGGGGGCQCDARRSGDGASGLALGVLFGVFGVLGRGARRRRSAA